MSETTKITYVNYLDGRTKAGKAAQAATGSATELVTVEAAKVEDSGVAVKVTTVQGQVLHIHKAIVTDGLK